MSAALKGVREPVKAAALRLYAVAKAAGLQPRITSGYRSRRTQTRLYRNWLRGLSPFPAAPPGRSRHELGLAFDMVVNRSSALTELGRLWESWGGTWGGRFRDPIHFELRPPP